MALLTPIKTAILSKREKKYKDGFAETATTVLTPNQTLKRKSNQKEIIMWYSVSYTELFTDCARPYTIHRYLQFNCKEDAEKWIKEYAIPNKLIAV